MNLLMFDGADADDDKADPAKVAAYRGQMQSLLANAPPHAWLLTHRPIWALAQGEGAPQGAMLNATEQAAIRDQVPPSLDMILSGHVHDFTSYEFGPAAAGTARGGRGRRCQRRDRAEAGHPASTIDGMKLRRAFALSDYGYVLLHRTAQAWTATVYSIADTGPGALPAAWPRPGLPRRRALMPDPTREAAFDLLTAVLDRRRPLEEALDALPSLATARSCRGASPRRRGAAPAGHAGRGAGAVPPQGTA